MARGAGAAAGSTAPTPWTRVRTGPAARSTPTRAERSGGCTTPWPTSRSRWAVPRGRGRARRPILRSLRQRRLRRRRPPATGPVGRRRPLFRTAESVRRPPPRGGTDRRLGPGRPAARGLGRSRTPPGDRPPRHAARAALVGGGTPHRRGSGRPGHPAGGAPFRRQPGGAVRRAGVAVRSAPHRPPARPGHTGRPGPGAGHDRGTAHRGPGRGRPSLFGPTEPAALAWDTRGLTGLCRDRAPRSSRLVFTGPPVSVRPEGVPAFSGTLRVRRTRDGLRETVTLAVSHSPGSAPDPSALVPLVRELADRGVLHVMEVRLRRGRPRQRLEGLRRAPGPPGPRRSTGRGDGPRPEGTGDPVPVHPTR
ncbi:DUF6177 family protein [Nocardiopsis sp. LOL_012]|uniref:DUF6177 family protein n=1 Tax=Nocardiopsis sp. LOL_012 TaxID=3345409 RepID=UPI003A835B35